MYFCFFTTPARHYSMISMIKCSSARTHVIQVPDLIKISVNYKVLNKVVFNKPQYKLQFLTRTNKNVLNKLVKVYIKKKRLIDEVFCPQLVAASVEVFFNEPPESI